MSETTAYSADQYEENYPEGVERHFWHVARNATIATELRRRGMDRMPLLDVGCGRGIIVDYLQRRGLDCVGCELGHPRVPERLRGAVLTGCGVEALPEGIRARVRGALLCDVLEHLPRQGQMLREVVRALPALTHVLVTVPARQELWSDWDTHYGHFRRYDAAMLASELTLAGLTVVSVRYFLHALYAPMLLARGRKRATTIAAPRLLPLHRLLGRAFIAEEHLLPPWVPGTSLVAVATVGARPG